MIPLCAQSKSYSMKRSNDDLNIIGWLAIVESMGNVQKYHVFALVLRVVFNS